MVRMGCDHEQSLRSTIVLLLSGSKLSVIKQQTGLSVYFILAIAD